MRECEICGDMTEAEICLSCVEKKSHRTERWMRKIMRREAARWRTKKDLQGGCYEYEVDG